MAAPPDVTQIPSRTEPVVQMASKQQSASGIEHLDLIQAAHEGPFEAPLWNSFLEGLRDIMGADYTSIAFRRISAEFSETVIMKAGKPQEEFQPELLSSHGRDLRRMYEGLTPNVIYKLDDMLRTSNPAHRRYIEYLRLRGFNYTRTIKIKESGGATAWLGVTKRDSEFSADADAILSHIAPHLALSVRTLTLLERQTMRAEITADAVRRLNFTWFTLDATGRIVELEPEAADLLRNIPAFKNIRMGRPLPALTPRSQSALLGALQEFSTAPTGRPRAIHLLDDPWLDMLVVPIKSRSISTETPPVAVVYVHGSGATNVDRREQLMDLFGLSRSEAALALALSQGKGIPTAAKELGFTIETARNYSKRIYAKTATRSQADLVRLIMASVVALT